MPNVCIPITVDTTLDGKQPTVNFGTAVSVGCRVLIVGSTKTTQERGLIYAAIPPEVAAAEVYKAFLSIWWIAGNVSAAAWLARVTQTAWTEAGATWNKYDGATNWATAGGDVDIVTPAAVAFTIPASGQLRQEIDITDHVKDAITNRGGALHLLAWLNDENPAATSGGQWASAEMTGSAEYLQQSAPSILIVRPPFGMPMEV